VDGYHELEFGRDLAPPGSDKPRIRLKDMEVSKLHATVYWDSERQEWAVVDMGSKHGTFIQVDQHSSSNGGSYSAAHDDPRGRRLSPPRVSSIPCRLRHLDQLSFGSTTFSVHIHEDGIPPCEECTSRGGDEIPLFDARKLAAGGESIASSKRKREMSEHTSSLQSDPKKALTMLKRTLLSRHDTASLARGASYIDRSARRRALHPEAKIMGDDSPFNNSASTTSLLARTPTSEPARPLSPPPALPSSNFGHRLLIKQGWAPGTALRSSESATSDSSSSNDLVDPLEVKVRPSRAGLGLADPSLPAAATPQHPGLSWRDEGKYRRWSSTSHSSSR